MTVLQLIEDPQTFADVNASELTLQLNGETREGVARIQVVLGDITIEPVILGSSHQVVVSGSGGLRLVETVAADAGGHPLPEEATHLDGGIDYLFQSQTRHYRSSSAFVRSVGDIRSRCAQDRYESIVVCSPDSPSALTAVAVERDRPAWTSWHAYPETGEIVRTRSELR